MSKLLTRIISGLAFGILTFASIYFGYLSASIYLGVVMIICVLEFSKIQSNKKFWPIYLSLVVYSIAYFSFLEDFKETSSIRYLSYTLSISVMIGLVFLLYSKSKAKLNRLISTSISLIYLTLPFSLALGLGFINDATTYNPTYLLAIFIMLWFNDSFAFFVGKKLGRTPLAPKISPKKTVEGLIGGMLFTMLAAFILSIFFTEINAVEWTVLGFLVSISGVLGDLLESFFKRKAGVKDSGNSIPGHGGFLDRLDSFIFTVPVAFIYLKIIFYVS